MATQRTERVPATPGMRTTVSVSAGETSPPVGVCGDAIVTVSPGSGGTMLAQATWSTPSDVNAGTAVWFDWDAGTVSAKAIQTLSKATAVRFVAATATGTGEVAL